MWPVTSFSFQACLLFPKRPLFDAGGLELPQGPALADSNSDTSIARLSTKWRLAMARRWLLRSLHWLLGPVFLRPLGLQDEEPSAAGEEGIGDSSTVVAKATVAGE